MEKGTKTAELQGYLKETGIGGLIELGKSWELPKMYADRTVLRDYKRFGYPTEITETARESREFAIPDKFDPSNMSHNLELQCELFAGSLLVPCIFLEASLHRGKSIREMTRVFQIPAANLSIRIAQYHMLRFSASPETRELLMGLERAAFTLYAEAYEETNGEIGLKELL